MRNNVASVERVIRVIVGIVLLALIFVGPRSWWGLIGIIPLATGLIGNCPLYSILGISTCGSRSRG